MNIIHRLSSFIILLIILSCSSDENVSPKESVVDFYRLETGAFWVYDWYFVNGESSEPRYKSDTVIITGDTLINERKYYIQSPDYLQNTSLLIFDSANTIYTFPDRSKIFTLNEDESFTQEFGPDNEPIARADFSLSSSISVDVPAGVFDCINWKGEITSLSEPHPSGNKSNDNFYSKGVGLVKSVKPFFASDTALEMKLVSWGSLEKESP